MSDTGIRSVPFLGLRFHDLTLAESVAQVEQFIAERAPRMVFTPTAELIVFASDQSYMRDIYARTAILTVDSFVVYYAARLRGIPLREPVSAARMMLSFLPVADAKKYRIYLLGATEEVNARCAENIARQFPGIVVAGRRNGYFDFNHDDEVVRDIREAKPDILFVAMSSPLKEKFVSKNIQVMNVPVSMGVGGTFDIIAGKCKLAPAWISRLGCEWLFRLFQEPRRLFKRYLVTNTRFCLLWIRDIFGGSN